MKKIIYALGILSLLITPLQASAVTYPSGCTATTKYSATTGKLCSSTVLPADCAAGDKFSSITGLSCSVRKLTDQEVLLQQIDANIAKQQANNPINSAACISAQNAQSIASNNVAEIGKQYDSQITRLQNNNDIATLVGGSMLSSGQLTAQIQALQSQKAQAQAQASITLNAKVSDTSTACGLNIPSQYSIPTAMCKDGTLSYSLNHSGSCSYHGGVLVFFK